MWLVMAAQFAGYVVLRKRFVLGGAAVVAALVAYGSLPASTQERVQSLLNVLEGRPDAIDTSGAKRWTRAKEALDYALSEPMGHGWGASGWVHSDFIQVAANQGWIAAAALLFGYLATLIRLALRLRSPDAPPNLAPLGLPLVLGFIAVGAILLYEGVEFLPQTMLPVWLFWALAETWLIQTAPPQRPRRQRTRPAVVTVPTLAPGTPR
jgi:hypothetical protein